MAIMTPAACGTSDLNPEIWNVPLTHIHIIRPSLCITHGSITPESYLVHASDESLFCLLKSKLLRDCFI